MSSPQGIFNRHEEIRLALRFFLQALHKAQAAGAATPDKRRVLFDFARYKGLRPVVERLATPGLRPDPAPAPRNAQRLADGVPRPGAARPSPAAPAPASPRPGAPAGGVAARGRAVDAAALAAGAGAGAAARGGGARPVTKEELGRATWTFLHTLAAQFPERPTRQQQRDARDLIGCLTRLYPCADCADHFQRLVRADPPDLHAASGVEMARPLLLLLPLLLPLLLLGTGPAAAHDIPGDCVEDWFDQTLDHFRWERERGAAAPRATFRQRFFVCNATYDGRGPIFFYAGNEGPLEGYIRNSGLMFENRVAHGALVVFAEHRFYGQTQPSGADYALLTSQQALADYAALLWTLKRRWGVAGAPVVAFGGSYGGMLAAWLRRQYPHIVVGAVASSAPVGQFPGGAGFRPEAFWDVVTRDATPTAGAAPDCAANVRAGFAALFAAGATRAGRDALRRAFRLCEALTGEADVEALAYWVQGAFDAYAMGNYHFASDYMSSPGAPLPAWPMRAACARMSRLPPARAAAARRALRGGGAPAPAAAAAGAGAGGDVDLLVRLRRAAALLYNATADKSCFSLELSGPAAGNTGPWDWQVCTEFLGQELPYFPASRQSMFWDQGPFDWPRIEEHCREAWGVTPSPHASLVAHGGRDWRGVSNVVFSNGLQDPWSAFGVLEDVSDSVVAVVIPDGAHHSDLMYSRPDDSEALTAARATIMRHVARWVAAARSVAPA
ncbi:DPP7 [Scenedesmus sp. PABB004]|nr:DPP7 [Scenedesmus sp. PABB004]